MNFKCAVKNCSNSFKKCDLFASPHDERLNKQWQKAVDTNEFNFYVCENHFYKKDIFHEKTLKEAAVPRLRLKEENFQLENNCCGFCLEDLDDPFEIQNEYKNHFMEITGYGPLTDLMCAPCKLGLMRYQKFVTEIKQKHNDIRNLVSHEVMKNTESDDDCVIIDDDDDDDDVDSIKSNESSKDTKSIFEDDGIDEMLMKEIPNAEFVDIRGIDEILSKDLESLSDIDLIENEPKKVVSATTKKDVEHYIFKDKVKCLTCEKLMDVDQLLKHRLSEHPEPQVFNSPVERVKKTYKYPSKEITCELCNKKIKVATFKYHYDAFHNDQPRSFLCHVCSKAFYHQCHLNEHLRSHDSDSYYKCDLCGVKDLRKYRIKKHILYHHLNIAVYQGQCKICLQKIAKKMNKHMKTYHPDGFDCGARVNSETNYFDCFKCGASYADLFTYRRHDCEKGRFQIRCNDCQKPVKNLENLQKHQKYSCLKKPRQGIFKKDYA